MQRKNVLLSALVAVLLIVGVTAPVTAGSVRVGVAYDGPGLGDLSFDDMVHEGIVLAEQDFPVRIRELDQLLPSGKFISPRQVVKRLSNKSDLVIAVGFVFTDAVAAMAEKKPHVNYALIDAFVDAPNVASISFAANEGSFLVGAAAALTSETDTIGFIGGVDMEVIHPFEAGFVAGVHHINPGAEVLVEFISTPPDFSGFSDPAGAYALATTMYDSGADVVYHAAGFSGLGLFEAARDYSAANEHVWAIGVDSDQYLAVDDDLKPYVLTSMMKRVDTAAYDMIEAEVTGTFTGGFHWYDLAVGGVGYSTSGGYVDGIVGELEAIKASIIDGTIVVPYVP